VRAKPYTIKMLRQIKVAVIKASLPIGKYYVRVAQYDKIRNSGYKMKISAKGINTLSKDPGNTMDGDVYDIIDSENLWRASDIVGMTDPEDYYRFKLSQPKDVSIVVTGTVEWLRVYLHT